MIRFYVGLAVAALVGATPATAAQASDPVSGLVDVRDLDFAKPSDVTRFDRRVRQQARSLCNVGARVTLSARQVEDACQAGVLASAQRELPQLMAAAKARSPKRLASR